MVNDVKRLKVYLESTIPSYFTARPSADAVKASRQAATIRWHERFFADNNLGDRVSGLSVSEDPDARRLLGGV